MGRNGSTFLVYIRQSYHRVQDADVSPEQQEAAARALLPAEAAVEVIRDVGGHRSGRNDRRPGFQELLRRIQDADVAGVAVYDLSRVGRSGRLVLNLHHELERRNLELLVANVPSGFRGATGRYMLGQLALAAQLQADLDSERMVGLTRTKHDAGGHNGRDPFGYAPALHEQGRLERPHRLVPLADEAGVIGDMFDAYGSGRLSSYAAIAADLNRRGIARRGKPWSKQSVRDIFRRAPFYAGSAVYRRGADLRPGLHEPVISAEQRQLAERMARRQRWSGPTVPRHRTWPLQGVAYCGQCGRRMWSETQVRPGRGE